MKKVISIAVAVLLIALSVMPAFAESVTSPKATTANYVIYIDEDAEGGKVVYDFETSVGEDGKQTVVIHGVPNEGYEFSSWTIDGDYVPSGSLSDADLELVIAGDIKVHPVFVKAGEPATKAPDQPKQTDDSSKSPKTGTDTAVPYVVVTLAVAALAAVVFTAKRRAK